MASGPELAKAYVQILPSAQGLGKSIIEDVGGAGDSAGESLGSRLIGTLKKVLAAAGIAKFVGECLNQGAALEQSIGGIETLFGNGGRSLQEYAKDVGLSVEEAKGKYDQLTKAQEMAMSYADSAWKTCGLSANDYMEQSTSFAASLISSCEGDTVKAAQAANTAMIDMSDNANKMGTSMESIQNAYQGFAKQNYTMLDNLKLGGRRFSSV